MSGAFVCRHHNGYWSDVSGDQFGQIRWTVSTLPMRHVSLRRNITKRNKDTGVCWMQTIVLSLIKRWPSTLIRWKINAGSHLYNPVTGQIAPEYVNVADSLLIGERMAECYSASLPGGFYSLICCPIQTMGDAMKSKRNPDKPAIDLENIIFCSFDDDWPEKTA